MWGNFVSIGVEILDLSVVCPLVWDVEGAQDGAPVGIDPAGVEDVLVEVLVEVVHAVVEGEDDDLGGELPASGQVLDAGPATHAVWELATVSVAVFRIWKHMFFCYFGHKTETLNGNALIHTVGLISNDLYVQTIVKIQEMIGNAC